MDSGRRFVSARELSRADEGVEARIAQPALEERGEAGQMSARDAAKALGIGRTRVLNAKSIRDGEVSNFESLRCACKHFAAFIRPFCLDLGLAEDRLIDG